MSEEGNYKLFFTATRLGKLKIVFKDDGQGQVAKKSLFAQLNCEQSTTWCVAALSLFIVCPPTQFIVICT